MPSPPPLPPKPLALLRDPEVERRTGLSRSQRDEMEAAGRFPLRVPLSRRAIGWREDEIDSWVAARIAERDDKVRREAAYRARRPVPSCRRRSLAARILETTTV
jgi:prophage regulatory protein